MSRQLGKQGAESASDASPLSLLVHAADAQHPRSQSKKNGTGNASSAAKVKGENGAGATGGNGNLRRDLQDAVAAQNAEEQMMQRQVAAAARAEAAFQQQHGGLGGSAGLLGRGLEADLLHQNALAQAAQQHQQQAAAMALASDIRAAVAAAQIRQAAQFQNPSELLLARAAQNQFGAAGGGFGHNSALEQHLQELELARLEELERRQLLASAAFNAGGAGNSLAARQLELQEAQLRQEQADRQLQQEVLDRAGARLGGGPDNVGSAEGGGAGGSNVAGGSDSANKDSFQKTPGSVVVPCRARGMPMDHNFKTAYFVIPENVEHGEELICSYFACRNAGIKFRYCTHCKVPVAKRNFRKRHKHGKSTAANDDDDDSEETESLTSPVAKPESDMAPHPSPPAVVAAIKKDTNAVEEDEEMAGKEDSNANKTEKKRKQKQESSPKKAKAESAKEADYPELPPIPKQQARQKIDVERERRWGALLGKRPPTKDGSAMSGWLMEVLAVSDLDTPLGDTPSSVSVPPSKNSQPQPNGVHPKDDQTNADDGDKSSNKEESENAAASALVKKKRPLDASVDEDGENAQKEDTSSADNESSGGFAEWKDRKKHKGLAKKSLIVTS